MHHRRRRSLRCSRFHPHRYLPTHWGPGEMHHPHRSSHLHRRRSLEYRKSHRCRYRWESQLGLGGHCSLRNPWSHPRLSTRRCHHLHQYNHTLRLSLCQWARSWGHQGPSSKNPLLRLSSHPRQNPGVRASRPRCRTSSAKPTRRCHTRDLLRHHLAGRSHCRWHLSNFDQYSLSRLREMNSKIC